MQAISETPIQKSGEINTSTTISISWEMIAYSCLVVIAFLMRVAELDTIPMFNTETASALAAWNLVFPDAPYTPVIAESPIVFWLQSIPFTLAGANEFSARIFTALGGVAVGLTPLLFRDYLGRNRTFILSFLLMISPSLFISSRSSEPSVWMAFFVMLTLWGFWRFWLTQSPTFSLIAMISLFSLLFLSESGGIILGFILLLSTILAIWHTMLHAPIELEQSGDEVLTTIRQRLSPLFSLQNFGAGVLVVLIVSTGFMLYPAGFSMVGELFGIALQGFSQRADDAPLATPFLTLVYYEWLVVILAIIGMVLLYTRDQIRFMERLLIAWSLFGMIFSIIYLGGPSPAHAIWVVLPLTILASYTVSDMLTNRRVHLYSYLQFDSEDTESGVDIWWAKWILGLVFLALFMTLAIHLQEVGRGLVNIPSATSLSESFDLIREPTFARFRYSFFWLFIVGILFVMSYFLATSFWDTGNVLQGLGLGLFFFTIVVNLANGWNVAVENAGNPIELWHTNATHSDTKLLRETLFEVAERDTMGFPQIEVTALIDENIIKDNDILAWTLRDFENAQFITSLENTRQNEIVILPASLEKPDLGGSYVGQSFLIGNEWNLGVLSNQEILGWWLQRRVRIAVTQENAVILWLRQDVYDGIPSEERIQ